MFQRDTVNPHKKPAGINIFHDHQLRVLIERGYYYRAGIIITDTLKF